MIEWAIDLMFHFMIIPMLSNKQMWIFNSIFLNSTSFDWVFLTARNYLVFSDFQKNYGEAKKFKSPWIEYKKCGKVCIAILVWSYPNICFIITNQMYSGGNLQPAIYLFLISRTSNRFKAYTRGQNVTHPISKALQWLAWWTEVSAEHW